MSDSSFSDKSVRMFFYIAPLIGLICGILYLHKQKKRAVEVTISRVRLEENIKSIIYRLDPQKCVNRKKLHKEVHWMVKKLDRD